MALKLPEKYISADLLYDKCIMYLWMDLYKTPHLTQGHSHKTVGVTVNTLTIIGEFLPSLPFIKENYFVSLSTSLLTKPCCFTCNFTRSWEDAPDVFAKHRFKKTLCEGPEEFFNCSLSQLQAGPGARADCAGEEGLRQPGQPPWRAGTRWQPENN